MKRILLIALAIGTLAFAFSCKKTTQKSADELKAEKIAFFTQKLELTPAEAEEFWPVYNEYWERKYKIIDEKRAAMKYCTQNMSSMPDEEIAKYADLYISFQKQEADLLVEFNEKFKSIIPPSKVLKLYQADYEFKSYLLQQIKKSGKK